MSQQYCPICNTVITMGFGNTDFVHKCSVAENETIGEEDLLRTNVPGWNLQGQGNEVDPIPRLQGVRENTRNPRGNRTDVVRTRQRNIFIDKDDCEC